VYKDNTLIAFCLQTFYNLIMKKMNFPARFFTVLVFPLLFLAATGFCPGEENGDLKAAGIGQFAGTWSGHGAGEEVRFRDKKGLLVLTVKHKTEFVFHAGKDGRIEGEGTIEYNLEKNTSGLDDLVAGVHVLMGLAQVPGIVVEGALGDTAKKVGEEATSVKGVTRIQYDAPHLKHGPETRHFKFSGTIRPGTYKGNDGKDINGFLINLDEVLNFTLMGDKPDNTLSRDIYCCLTSSTRRFWARPSSVALSATGLLAP
jgi:hypothetical protein